MKLSRVLVLLLAALLFVSLPVAIAQEPEGERTCTYDPDDGSGLPECETPDDNECFEGGDMEGRCHHDYEWLVGWFLARYKQGLLPLDVMPQWVQDIFRPPERDDGDRVPEGECINLAPVGMAHIDILLDLTVDHQIAPIFFAGTKCTREYPNGTPPAINFAVVFAPDMTTAHTSCATYFGLATPTDYTAAYPKLYRCSVY